MEWAERSGATADSWASAGTRNGQGHKMACWAGGMIEPTPRGWMAIGGGASGPWGTAPMLMLNSRGKRFMNEGAIAQMQATCLRQPAGLACYVTDANWAKTLKAAPLDHGAPNFGMQDYWDKIEQDMNNTVSGQANTITIANLAERTQMAGTIYRADTLEELAATSCESFYRGSLMERMVSFSRETGGFFQERDLQDYRPEWVEPITADYKGYTVCEIPPNGHGITVLMALNILKGLPLSQERDSADTYHKILEAIKLAFADTRTYVADPRYMRTRVADLLSEDYAARRRALIGERALLPQAGDPSCGGTIYLCTADPQGNMVSFIQSNYTTFGAGIRVPGTGICLQNRGANFSLDEGSDNCLAGGKKSYHTIIPGFLMKEGTAVGPFGVMGAFMQPQGHVQVVVNTVDYHMNPQECLDAPRMQWTGGKRIQLEREVPAHIGLRLAEMGHQVEICNSNLDMGRGQIIWRMEDGTLAGGTEPRCDGTVAAW